MPAEHAVLSKMPRRRLPFDEAAGDAPQPLWMQSHSVLGLCLHGMLAAAMHTPTTRSKGAGLRPVVSHQLPSGRWRKRAKVGAARRAKAGSARERLGPTSRVVQFRWPVPVLPVLHDAQARPSDADRNTSRASLAPTSPKEVRPAGREDPPSHGFLLAVFPALGDGLCGHNKGTANLRLRGPKAARSGAPASPATATSPNHGPVRPEKFGVGRGAGGSHSKRSTTRAQ
mmetsp:Transcript_4122/g.11046  ORF Transcript_4122/g.11046 Transcript_4122/m.11046 type:complete len:228 (-) Transcript_4122:242-925(-)